jgi:serine/threonine protein kinase
MAETQNALPVGYTLLEYRIEAMLGAGGFGLTYLAHDANLNTKVAIKEYMPAEFAARGEDHSVQPKTAAAQKSFAWGLQRFLDESRTLASFRHSNIVRVMRFFEANHTAYMVMEFIAGKPLNEWIKERNTLDQARLTAIAIPLLDGLEVIHEAGYLHRDIKPANIFIRQDGNPVLIDFGSARMKVDPDQNLTAVVTPGFSPLEQYHSQGKQGPWTDIYSFAGVFYWLVTGRKPVEAAARVRGDIMPSALNSGDRKYYSAEFLAAIDWGLRPHEQDRPQSVAKWRVALSSCGVAAFVPAVSPAPAAPSPQPGVVAQARSAPQVAPAPQADRTSGTGMPTSVVFDQETLKRFENELARHVGPIAGVMVRNAAKTVTAVAELAVRLAPEIADVHARAAFVRKLSSDTTMPPSRLQNPTQTLTTATQQASEKINASALQRFGDDTLRRVEMDLAPYIGAVARVMVKRAANKARDESELYVLLADEIEDKAEKKNFMRKALSVARRL